MNIVKDMDIRQQLSPGNRLNLGDHLEGKRQQEEARGRGLRKRLEEKVEEEA